MKPAMTAGPVSAQNNPAAGVFFILVGMACISVNDMLIKLFSGDYPLHQTVFVCSAIAIVFSLIFVQFEGGFSILRTKQRNWMRIFGTLKSPSDQKLVGVYLGVC
jgi:S-adenosylmethionine uptake transporter